MEITSLCCESTINMIHILYTKSNAWVFCFSNLTLPSNAVCLARKPDIKPVPSNCLSLPVGKTRKACVNVYDEPAGYGTQEGGEKGGQKQSQTLHIARFRSLNQSLSVPGIRVSIAEKKLTNRSRGNANQPISDGLPLGMRQSDHASL